MRPLSALRRSLFPLAAWGVFPLAATLWLPCHFVSGTSGADFGVALGAFAFCVWASWRAVRRAAGGRFGVSLSEAGVGLCLLLLLLADARSGAPSQGVWIDLAACTGLFVAWRRVWAVRARPAMAFAAGLAAVYVAEWLWAAFQAAGWWPASVSAFRVTGGFDNPAGLAVAALAFLPGAWAWSERLPRRWRCVLWPFVSLMGVALCLWAGSRAGLLALGAALCVLLVRSVGPRGRCVAGWALGVAFLVATAVALRVFKPASTTGRWTVCRVAVSLVADAPWSGRGTSGFLRDYMPRQAEWLARHATPQERQLAGQVRHPLSEYLSAAVAGGLPLCLLVCGGVVYVVRRGWRGGPDDAGWLAVAVGMAVLSLFSYPLFYALGRLLLVASAAWLCRGERVWLPRGVPAAAWSVRLTGAAACVLSLACLVFTAVRTADAWRWNVVARRALAGGGRAVLPDYARLSRRLSADGSFLYNYAAELHYAGDYVRSDSVWRRCVRFRRDYDTEFLAASNALALCRYAEAERHLLRASAMMPVRFAPLYVLLTEVYVPRADTVRALALARHLVGKPVKIPSADVDAMKARAASLVRSLRSGPPSPVGPGRPPPVAAASTEKTKSAPACAPSAAKGRN